MTVPYLGCPVTEANQMPRIIRKRSDPSQIAAGRINWLLTSLTHETVTNRLTAAARFALSSSYIESQPFVKVTMSICD